MFTADTSSLGRELYVTDGTSANTLLLKDINSGSSSSSPQSFTSLGDKIVFTADGGSSFGRELYVTDGTAANTSLLKDINSGSQTSSPQLFASLGNGKALFTADAGSGLGRELYVTDGTTAGTILVKDIYPGSQSSSPQLFATLGNGKAIFSADDGSHDREVWVTDGTTAGTFLLKDIGNNSDSLRTPSFFGNLGNGKVLFTADDSTTGREVWVTDGTTSGTFLLKDILPGSNNDSLRKPLFLGSLGNGKVLFTAEDNTNGREVWVTDGTTSGTFLLKDILPGSNNDSLRAPTFFSSLGDGKALFLAEDNVNGREVWVTDGTTAGTLLLKDILPGSSTDSLRTPTFLGKLGADKVLFTAVDNVNGREVWVTDGTTVGTFLLKDIMPGSSTDSLTAPTFLGSLGASKALFVAVDNVNGREVWVTDGTSVGTFLLKDIYPGSSTDSLKTPSFLVSLSNGKSLFSAVDNTNGREAWVTDGTSAGTLLLKDIYSGSQDSTPQLLALASDKALFTADSSALGREIYVTDGTPLRTYLTRDIYPNSPSSSATYLAGLSNGDILVVADDGSHGRELWVVESNEAPVANAGGPYSTAEGSITALNALASTDRDQDSSTLVYTWDLDGDGIYGETSTAATWGDEVGSSPSLRVGALDGSRSYTIGLRVTDSGGKVGVASTTLQVNNSPPSASLTFSGTQLEGSPITISFLNSTDPSDADAAALLYSYDFNNDGDFIDAGEATDVASSSRSFTYPQDGFYTVRGRIKDKDGGSTTYTTSFSVLNVPPTLNAGADDSLNEGQTFSRTGTFTDPGADSWTATVNYGDGSGISTLSLNTAAKTYSLNHLYPESGVYSVLVTITDGQSQLVLDTVLVTVNNLAPTASFVNSGPATPGVQGTVSFTGALDSPGDVAAGFRYSYDFNNDGDFTDAGEAEDISSASRSYAFDAGGIYTVHGRIKDRDGGYSDYTTNVTISIAGPQNVALSLAATTINEDSTATLGAAFVNLDALSTHTAQINWGDGSSVQTINLGVGVRSFSGVTHLYTTPTANGTSYNIRVTIADQASHQFSENVSLVVNAVNDMPSFTKGTNQTVSEDSGLKTVAGWAAAISVGPADEASQTLQFIVTNDNNSLFKIQPSVSSNGTLTFTPAADAFGTSIVSVRLQDNGGVANGGQDTSGVQTFTVTITAVNDAPLAVDDVATTPRNVPITFDVRTNDSRGPNEGDQSLGVFFNQYPQHGAIVQNADGTLTYTPTTGYFGSDSFVYSVQDDGNPALTAQATGYITITAPLPTLLKDIHSGSQSSTPQSFATLGDKIVFTADGGASIGRELYVTDGTTANTLLLKDVYPGSQSSSLQLFASLGNGKALFTADAGGGLGRELYVTDGTTAGTILVKDVLPGSQSSSPQFYATLGNGKAIFSADDGVHYREVWVTDGTAAGTFMVKDIGANSDSLRTPSFLGNLGNGKVLFTADDNVNGREVWVTDGTTAGTFLLKDILPGSNNDSLRDPEFFGNLSTGKVLFTAEDNINGREVWVTDGTTAGTFLLKDILSGSSTDSLKTPTFLGKLGADKVLFAAVDNINGREVWVTDGTSVGTFLLKDIMPGSSTDSLVAPTYLGSLGANKALFAAVDNINGREVWVTDGTTANTILLKDIYPGSSTDSLKAPSFLASLSNGKALFSAVDNTNGREVWVTDGASAGTLLLKDIYPGSQDSSPQFLALANGKAIFSAISGSSVGRELWVTDGAVAGTALLKDINSSGDSNPTLLTAVDDKVYFSATAGSPQGREPWVTDGTVAGTFLIKDINTSSDSSPLFIATLASGNIVFSADSGSSQGRELWVSDLNEAPAANIYVSSFSLNEGVSYTLDGSASSDREQAASTLTFEWDLDGDGIYGETGAQAGLGDEVGVRPVIRGESLDDAQQQLTIGLRVTDLRGATSSTSTTLSVFGVAPTAVFTRTGSLLEGSPLTFSFENASDPSDADNAALRYSFDFNNDGDFLDAGEIADSTSPSRTFTFPQDGTYTVRGVVRDKELYSTSYTVNFTLANVQPTLNAGPDITINEGQFLGQVGTFIDPGSEFWSARVNYGEGSGTFGLGVNSFSRTYTLSRLYNESGVYAGGATITDNQSALVSDTFVVYVNNVAPTATFASGGAVLLGTPTTVSFLNSTDPSPGDRAAGFGYSYDFNNDGDFSDAGELADGASITTLSYTFPNAGTFTVRGRIKDRDGGFTDYTTNVIVHPPGPRDLNLAVNPVSILENDNTTLTGSFVNYDTQSTNTVRIVWGDNTSDTVLTLNPGVVSFNTTHRYADNNPLGSNYAIQVTVSDPSDIVSGATNIVVANVQPVFEAGPNESLPPSAIGSFQRAHLSFTDPGADAWTGAVDFGDGVTETLTIDQTTKTFDLNHVYSQEGHYRVTVTINDGDAEGVITDFFFVDVFLNTPPVAVNDSISTGEDSFVVFNVLNDNGNGPDRDAENNLDPAHTIALTSPSRGTLLNTGNGTFKFDPNHQFEYLAIGQITTESFTYQIQDSFGEVSSATVLITITGVNDLPQAVNDIYNIDEDGVLSVPTPGVLANDIDIDGDPITAVGYFNASHGVVNAITNGSFGYTPQANYNGADSFIYKIWDGHGDYTNDHSPSTYATVNITIRAVNDAPVAVDDNAVTNEDQPLTLTAADLKGNDTDIDNTNSQLTVTAVSWCSTPTEPSPSRCYHGPAGFDYGTDHVSTSHRSMPQAVNDSYTIDGPAGDIFDYTVQRPATATSHRYLPREYQRHDRSMICRRR
ncbi:MAG: Ig-like domain-containing protein [Pirellulales bacterium]